MPPDKPPCFPSLQSWQEWRALAGETVRACEDCTPQYRDRMNAAGRCEHPDTVFAVDADGFLRGLKQTRKPTREKGCRTKRAA